MKSHIYKRGRTWWYQRGRQPNRVRLSLNTKNKTIAEERQRSLDQEFWLKENCPGLYVQGLLEKHNITLDELILALNDRVIGKVVDITLEEASEQFLSELTFEKDATKKNKYRQIRKMVKYLDGTRKISEITERDINLLLKDLKEVDGMRPATRKTHQTALKQMFRALAKRYDIKNPCEDVKNVKVPNEVKKAIPEKLLFDTIRNNTPELYVELAKKHRGSKVYFNPEFAEKDKIFWTLIAFTGMNVGDAHKVTKADFEQVNHREKTGEIRMLCMVDQLAEYGDDLFNIFTLDQARRSSRRFSLITGWTLSSVRKWYANKIVPILPQRDAKVLMGHSQQSNALNTNYLRPDNEMISKKMQNAFNDIMPVKARA